MYKIERMRRFLKYKGIVVQEVDTQRNVEKLRYECYYKQVIYYFNSKFS